MAVRNVLLITIDSLRYDRALGMDGAADRAPTLNRLAEEFVSFDQAIANGPNTPSSFPTILTSTNPLMYGGYRYLDDARPFVSRTLKQAGFRTVGYHSNPHLGPEKNYNHGFDTFNDGGERDTDARSLKNFVDRHVDPDSILYKLLRRTYHLVTMTADTSAYAKAPAITAKATDWLTDDWDGETPFFMWLHYMDVHYPFTPPAECLERLGVDPPSRRRVAKLNGKMQEDTGSLSDQDVDDLRSLYDGEMLFLDDSIDRLLSDLERRAVLDETAVVVTADHGEAFGEHGRFGHHPYLYDELLHVPLVMRLPDVDSRRIDQQVSLIDLPPTLYDLVGVEVPEGVQGRSLVGLMNDETSVEDEDGEDGAEADDSVVICTSRGGDMLSTRTPKWKLLWDREVDDVELYGLESDPGESRNVSEENPAVVERFRGLLEDHVAEARETDTELPDVEESDEVKQRLEDLGYVD